MSTVLQDVMGMNVAVIRVLWIEEWMEYHRDVITVGVRRTEGASSGENVLRGVVRRCRASLTRRLKSPDKPSCRPNDLHALDNGPLAEAEVLKDRKILKFEALSPLPLGD